MNYGTLPCASITSLNLDASTVTSVISDSLRLVGSPVAEKDQGIKVGETIQLGCVSHDSPQRKSLLWE